MDRFLIQLNTYQTTMAESNRILVVDDNQDLTQIVSMVLTGNGYEVKSCYSIPDAVNIVNEWHPEVLVLDINISGEDGRTFCSDLKEQSDQPIKVILMSGYDNNLGAAIWHGADDFIAKPFGMDELVGKVKLQLLNNSLQDKL